MSTWRVKLAISSVQSVLRVTISYNYHDWANTVAHKGRLIYGVTNGRVSGTLSINTIGFKIRNWMIKFQKHIIYIAVYPRICRLYCTSPPPSLSFFLLLKIIMMHPYLKILDLANLFVADADMKKKSRNLVIHPSQGTLKYGSENLLERVKSQKAGNH